MKEAYKANLHSAWFDEHETVQQGWKHTSLPIINFFMVPILSMWWLYLVACLTYPENCVKIHCLFSNNVAKKQTNRHENMTFVIWYVTM